MYSTSNVLHYNLPLPLILAHKKHLVHCDALSFSRLVSRLKTRRTFCSPKKRFRQFCCFSRNALMLMSQVECLGWRLGRSVRLCMVAAEWNHFRTKYTYCVYVLVVLDYYRNSLLGHYTRTVKERKMSNVYETAMLRNQVNILKWVFITGGRIYVWRCLCEGVCNDFRVGCEKPLIHLKRYYLKGADHRPPDLIS